ncbi:MAG: hypothetical protein MJZ85_06730 [Bacteroidales bacterium]|nr:hypothetical protein [Bacteroidales bacterium]
MARERAGYRETIALMTDAGIGYLVTEAQMARFCGCHRTTIIRKWPELKGRFPIAKTEAARVICG